MDPHKIRAMQLGYGIASRKVDRFNRSFHGHSFGLMGHEIGTAGFVRGGFAVGLGALAVKDAQNTYQKLKYGEIGGAMLSAALTAGAAAGAVHMATNQNALKSVINFTSIRLRGASRALRAMR